MEILIINVIGVTIALIIWNLLSKLFKKGDKDG
jgi:hypothetical protein